MYVYVHYTGNSLTKGSCVLHKAASYECTIIDCAGQTYMYMYIHCIYIYGIYMYINIVKRGIYTTLYMHIIQYFTCSSVASYPDHPMFLKNMGWPGYEASSSVHVRCSTVLHVYGDFCLSSAE